MRRSSFQSIDISISRDVQTEYDNIRLVADSIAYVDQVAADLAKGIGTNQPTDSSVLNALNNAGIATTKAGEASVSAGAASTSESNAATSENNALVYLNDFKGRYFGGLASDPVVDLNGDALTDGDLYFNTTSDAFRAYNGTSWVELSTYTKAEIDTANVFRADKFLAVQNVANMIYTGNDLTKVQYITATDVDYEVFTYTGGNLTGIAHYVGGVLKGTTILSYSSGNLISAIFTGV